MAQFIIRRTAARHTLTVMPYGSSLDLSRYFTVTRDAQGVRADRAGEFQREVVNTVKGSMFLGL